ncbi:hypothetical protein Ocin01_15420 [Orchesella cincta]|uniref:Uncharacterized protein n=1 Tax=Orchesella cincta TaxID=48709 RepID=A0A1D2MEF4_ORCCI|nr:hypothetical protein Ocin01_15420 [Orchesella cincta]
MIVSENSQNVENFNVLLVAVGCVLGAPGPSNKISPPNSKTGQRANNHRLSFVGRNQRHPPVYSSHSSFESRYIRSSTLMPMHLVANDETIPTGRFETPASTHSNKSRGSLALPTVDSPCMNGHQCEYVRSQATLKHAKLDLLERGRGIMHSRHWSLDGITKPQGQLCWRIMAWFDPRHSHSNPNDNNSHRNQLPGELSLAG